MSTQNYIMYCRKSMESEDRQALSVPAQIDAIKTTAERMGVTSKIELIEESKSAKLPGKREGFNKLVSTIESGGEYIIFVWHADRLSRNPVDSAILIDLMDRQRLIKIVTPSQTYENNPNDKMWLAFSMIQAKYENDKKGVDVRRGLKVKAEMGWYPTHAPTGYLNPEVGKKGYRIVEEDPMRFPLMRKAFDEILCGRQAAEVWKEAREKWHLTTPLGKPISNSTFYNILNNPFYYGEYEWPRNSGNWYVGKHKPMITKAEFDQVQKMLGKYGKPVARSHAFDLTGLFRCAECQYSITGTKKTKYYKRTARSATYSYYHCTHKNRLERCTMPPITESVANEQVITLLRSIRPPQEFIDWAKKWIDVVVNKELTSNSAVSLSHKQALEKVDLKLNNLLDLRLTGEVDEVKYKSKKRDLEEERNKLTNISLEPLSAESKVREINNTLDFALAAANQYSNGKRNDKHFVLLKVGSNLLLKPKQIWIELKPEYLALKDSRNWENKYSASLEPQKYTEILSKNPDLAPANPVWLPR